MSFQGCSCKDHSAIAYSRGSFPAYAVGYLHLSTCYGTDCCSPFSRPVPHGGRRSKWSFGWSPTALLHLQSSLFSGQRNQSNSPVMSTGSCSSLLIVPVGAAWDQAGPWSLRKDDLSLRSDQHGAACFSLHSRHRRLATSFRSLEASMLTARGIWNCKLGRSPPPDTPYSCLRAARGVPSGRPGSQEPYLLRTAVSRH